ncbi:hypothetical protein [Catenuloplanes atrovinosus]|uniref:Uncharacterized protein n=1 Tax=Catenuloplanes atrovinosus TaxID=137266 RepID=A0AAE4CB22_9ACTN|nr:hypothetical protein [Catenuloplanes atrovinosus]MDR7277648.1 hypothetical protein [Catenuloplanes atrovinosus]
MGRHHHAATTQPHTMQPHTLHGARVEYIGEDFAWYGHQFTVTHRAHVDGHPRYVLTDDHGTHRISANPTEISPTNDALTSTWTRHFRRIVEYISARHGAEYGEEIAEILQSIGHDVVSRRYARARRHLLDLEHHLNFINSDEYETSLALLVEVHGTTD